MMALPLVSDASKLALHDLERIHYSLLSSSCLCRPIILPCVKATCHSDSSHATPLFMVYPELNSMFKNLAFISLLPSALQGSVRNTLPGSLTRVLEDASEQHPFTFELTEIPSLEPIPVPIEMQYLWMLNITLIPRVRTAHLPKFVSGRTVQLSLEPRFSSVGPTLSWLSSTCVLDSTKLQKDKLEQNFPSAISLCVLITTDLLKQTLRYSKLMMDVRLHLVCETKTNTIVISPPIKLTFSSLMTQLMKSHQLSTLTPHVAAVLPSVCSHRHLWHIRTSKQPILTVLDTLCVIFESKLGIRDARVALIDNPIWVWVRLGPFAGVALRLQWSESGENLPVLEARSSRKIQLDLLPKAITECADDLTLDSVQPEDTCPFDCTTVINNMQGRLAQLRPLADALLSEAVCLTDLISDLIERTMRDRIPPITELLMIPDKSRVDLAHRASDWHNKVSTAHLEPVQSTSASFEYIRCAHETDVAFSRFCFSLPTAR